VKVTVAIWKLPTSVHKGNKVMEEKNLCLYAFWLSSTNFPWDYPHAQHLSSRWLKKKNLSQVFVLPTTV